MSVSPKVSSRKGSLWLGAVLAIGALAGCWRSPQVVKQRDFDKGNAYFLQGKYSAAEIELQNAIQIDPQFAQAHYVLAQCYLKEGKWGLGYQELSRTVELTPGDLKAQMDLSNLLIDAGKFSDARDHAALVLKSDPRNPQAQIAVATADAGEGNLPKAIAEAQQAIQMDPNRAGSYLSLALLQQKSQDPASAEQTLKKAQSIDPKSVRPTLALGAFYQVQKQWPAAEKQFQAAIALDPKNPLARASLAKLYLDEHRPDAAEQTLKDASTAFSDNPAGYRLLGNFYLAQGQLDKASAEFASLHAQHPSDALVTKTYIQILVLQNHLDQAAQLDDALLKSSFSDPDALVLQGEILTRQGKASEAVPVLESAAKAVPDDASAHYQLGVAYAGISDFGQAQSQWTEAAQLAPNMIEPRRAIAELAARNGNTDLLASSSTRLIQIEPHSSEGYILHSRALLLRDDQAGAEADLKKAMDAAPGDAAPYARMGDLRVAQKKLDEAAGFYSRALALNPSATDALAGLVNVDLQRNQPAQALRRVQDQLAHAPADTNLYVLLGQVELRNQDPAKAEAAFQKAVDLDQNNVPAFLLLAGVQLSHGSVDQAIAGYQSALKSNPRDVRVYVALGSLLEARGDWRKAQDLYQRALQIEPDYPVAANDLAYLMLEHGGDVSLATTLAQTARRGLPNLPNSADTLGWAEYHQGVYEGAIDLFQTAIKGDPNNPTYHYHLGLAYQKSANYAMARKQFQSTLEIDPNFAHAAEIKSFLDHPASSQAN